MKEGAEERKKKFEITKCNQQGKETRKKEQKNHFKNFAFLKSKARKIIKEQKISTLESTSIFLQTNWRLKENENS